MGTFLVSSIFITGCSNTSKESEAIKQEGKSNSIVSENSDIENTPPVKLAVAAKDSESGKDQYQTDSDAVLKRYDSVDKSKLTYETKMVGDHKGTYFYESSNGFILKCKENDDLKPINDKIYHKMLLGYSYNSIENPLSTNDALDKIALILPDDAVKTGEKTYDTGEIIHFDSSKGEFLVDLGFAYSSNKKEPVEYDKNKIMRLNYFKTK